MADLAIQTQGMKEADKQYPLATQLEKKAKPEWDSIDYYIPTAPGVCVSAGYKRHFRVTEGNALQEWRNVDGKDKWVDASVDAPGRPAVQRYYYADGRVYTADGRCLGLFGINGDTKKTDFEGRQFLETYGTLQNEKGQLVDYYGKTLRFGDQTALIQLGPPPGLVAVYRKSKNNVLVDARHNFNGREQDGFRQVDGDLGFEKIWVKPGEAEKFKESTWTVAQVEELAAKSKPQDGYIYSEDGRIRFKITKSATETTVIAERRMHHTTNWRGSEGLARATVAWVRDDDLVRVNAVVTAGPNPADDFPGSRTVTRSALPLLPVDEKKGDVKAGGVGVTGGSKGGPPIGVRVAEAKDEKKVEQKPVVIVQAPVVVVATPTVITKPEVIPLPRVVVAKKTGDDVAVSGGTQVKKPDDLVVKKVDPTPPPPITQIVSPPDLPLDYRDPPPPVVQAPVVATKQDLLDAEAFLRLFEMVQRLDELTQNIEAVANANGAVVIPPANQGLPGLVPPLNGQNQGQNPGQNQGQFPGLPLPNPGGLPGMPQVPPQGFPPGGAMPGGFLPNGGMPNGMMPGLPVDGIDGNRQPLRGTRTEDRFEQDIVEPGRVWAQEMRKAGLHTSSPVVEALSTSVGGFREIVGKVKYNGKDEFPDYLRNAHGLIVGTNGQARGLYMQHSAEFRGPAGAQRRARLLKIIKDNMNTWTNDPAEYDRWEKRVLPLLEKELGAAPGGMMPPPGMRARPVPGLQANGTPDSDPDDLILPSAVG